jgi:hypothetical protein
MRDLFRSVAAVGFAFYLGYTHAQVHVPTVACQGTERDGCIVRPFKNSIEASILRGNVAYQFYCALCHGDEGKGNGRAARLHSPLPFNLTLSGAPREYTDQIVRKGGEAMGRGKGMPPWGEQLTQEQHKDVVNFLFSIRVNR